LDHIPPPAQRRLALRVTPAAQRALREGHPWLFADAVVTQSGEGQPGDLAVIFDDRGRFLAIGLYDPTSPLRVRVLQHGTPATIDQAWLRGKLAAAAARRAVLQQAGTTGYRLVHGENDGLPGLVIDHYAGTLVLKLDTLAWIPRLAGLLAALPEITSVHSVVLRLGRHLAAYPDYLYGLSDPTVLAGAALDGPVVFHENGLRFEADVLHGQKTGFFLDQRDNRARVEKLAAGRRSLNVFAYSGGFSLYAARGGAPEIVSVDASAPALAAAERNFALNRELARVAAARHTVLAADAFAALAELHQSGRRFELVIVDPPAFAHRNEDVHRALRTYGHLAGLALDVTAAGGVLVMSSCSSRVAAASFYATVNKVARDRGRPLQELERTGHPLDHPISFPEGAYLKCLFAIAP
jgi:23S rRNA (cytosine1962-C5)-methyltransferase